MPKHRNQAQEKIEVRMKPDFSLCLLVAMCLILASSSRPALHAQSASDNSQMIVKNSAADEFHPTPIMPQCFLGALQRINRETGAAVFLVRVDSKTGCVVPPHWHTSGEQITVVSGIVN